VAVADRRSDVFSYFDEARKNGWHVLSSVRTNPRKLAHAIDRTDPEHISPKIISPIGRYVQRQERIMLAKDMPDPDELIECSDGALCAAFLFHLGEGSTIALASELAAARGLTLRVVPMENDPALRDDDEGRRHPLMIAQENGRNVVGEWNPTSPGPDWKLAGKWDSEDGPLSFWTKAETN
jgi:hypothetical protein